MAITTQATQLSQPLQNFVPQLADRLSKALANSGRLSLDGENKFQHYNYPTVAQVRGHANKALAAAGLGIIPEIVNEGRSTRETNKGGTTNVTYVKLAIHVFAPEGMFTVRWVGESEDMTDKGLAKAVSAGIKSFLLAMMLMPVGEEENDDGETEAENSRARRVDNRKQAQQNDAGPSLGNLEPYNATNGKPAERPAAWPEPVITWAMNEFELNSTRHVTATLNLSKYITPASGEPEIKHWLVIYRKERSAGVASVEAARRADADAQAIAESAKAAQ